MLHTVHDSYEALANALPEATEEINQLLNSSYFHFAWEYDGWAAFTHLDKSFTFTLAATPAWDGVEGIPIQVTDEDGDQIDGTEDIEDVTLDKLTIAEYLKKIIPLLVTITHKVKNP